MVTSSRDRLIYDCNVYLQYLLNERGPAGRCVELVRQRAVEAFTSDAVILELRELPAKLAHVHSSKVNDVTVAGLVDLLHRRATHVADVPPRYAHPVDPDDSCYVDLALAAGADLVVSRDNHLLNLTNPAKPWSAEFRARFPHLRVLRPDAYLADRAARGV